MTEIPSNEQSPRMPEPLRESLDDSCAASMRFPLLDSRSADEILCYDENGRPR